MSNVTTIKVVLTPVSYGGWYVSIPGLKARALCARGTYGEDEPITDDREAYVQSDDVVSEALGWARFARMRNAAYRWGSACVLMTVDDAAALWRLNLDDSQAA